MVVVEGSEWILEIFWNYCCQDSDTRVRERRSGGGSRVLAVQVDGDMLRDRERWTGWGLGTKRYPFFTLVRSPLSNLV